LQDQRDSVAARVYERELHPAPASLGAIAGVRPTQHIATQPIAFMRPNRFSSATRPALQSIPFFDAQAREQARKNTPSALASAPENNPDAQSQASAEQKLAAQFEDRLTKKCQEFSIRLDRRLDSFYEQTAVRLNGLSEEIVRHVCEVLKHQITEALTAVVTDWSEQNRALVDAECHAALDRFAARLESISSSRLEGHRKEIQNLSAGLKIRLRGVAHALEELGPSSHRTL
jgi:hypothetical protein